MTSYPDDHKTVRKHVLVVSSGFVHPSLGCRYWLWRSLAPLHGVQFKRIPNLEKISRTALEGVDGLLLYFHHDHISQTTLDLLERYLESGGGLFALHAVSASFKDETRFYKMLGGSFVEHGPIETFEVRPSEEKTEFFGDIRPFQVRDELYRHEFDPENRIHFYTEVKGEKEPVVWTRQHGNGRVCYCALGHTTEAMRSQPVWQIIQKGLGWVTDAKTAQ
jgi:type 1 glutamine amidotransferase